MFAVLQILFVLAAIAAVIVFFGRIKHKPISFVAGLCVLTIIASGISAEVLSVIPMPTEQIRLTATGEKNEAALNNEVALSGIIADGKQYEVHNAVEGKWFWQSDLYMWRNEDDSRQPEGTTRSVTLEIPVGSGRMFVFHSNKYRGVVEIEYNGKSFTQDLYSEEGVLTNVKIPASDGTYDNFVKIGRLALYVLFITVLMFWPVFAVLRFSPDRIRGWFVRNWDKLVYITIAATCLVVMFNTGKLSSFWYDEVWTIGWTYSSMPDKACLIFNFLINITRLIAPYGQEYLLLMPEICVAISVIFFGMAGALYKSKRFGIIMASLFASSTTILFQCGLEFRNYGILILGIVLSFYFFIKKQKELESPKISTLILYGASIVVAMDSHTFGILTVGFMMIFDFVLIIKKKTKVKSLIEFILPAIYGCYWLFWLVVQFVDTLNMAYNYSWPPSPSTRGALSYVIWLCGNNYVNFSILILGLALITVSLIRKIIRHEFEFKYDYVKLVSVCVPVAIFAVNIFYSAVINPKNSLFVDRYFIPATVFFCFIMAIAADECIGNVSRLISDKSEKIVQMSASLTVFLSVSLCAVNWYCLPTMDKREDYKGAASYLMSQNDIYIDNTICLVTGNAFVDEGFEYYLTHDGKYDSINHAPYNDTDFNTDFFSYDTVYVVYIHSGFDTKIFENAGYSVAYKDNRLYKFTKYH